MQVSEGLSTSTLRQHELGRAMMNLRQRRITQIGMSNLMRRIEEMRGPIELTKKLTTMESIKR